MAEPLKELLDHLDGDELTPENIQAEIGRHERRLRLLKALADIAPAKKKTRKTSSNDEPAKPRGKPGRKPQAASEGETKPAKVAPADLSRRLGEFLKQNGPKRIDAIKNALGVTDHSLLEKVLAGEWFEKDNGLWTLSSDGHAAFRRDDDA